MKKKFLIVVLFFSVVISFGQEKTITKNFTRTNVEKIDFSKIYDKKTGVKISKKEFIQLVQNNPNLRIEKVYGLDGTIEKYLVDESKKDATKIKNTRNSPINVGEQFPNFIATTLNGTKIELEKLRGQIVLLRFELEASTFRFKKHEIRELDSIVHKTNQKTEKVTAIIFFASGTLDVKKGFDIQNSAFEVIPNSLTFQEKFSIKRFPTTLIIDKKGKLVANIKNMDDLDLSNYPTE